MVLLCDDVNSSHTDLGVGRYATVPTPGLLDLPAPILQLILASSGSGGLEAARSCAALRKAFQSALACPELAAIFLIKRYGPNTALFHVYNASQLRDYLLCGVHDGTDQDCVTNKLVRELLRMGASPRVQERFLLTAAAAAGDTSVVRTLLRAGVNAGSCGGRALVAASAAGHVAVMEVLLRAGVSARAENGMPLRAACREGRVAAARLLLCHGADPRAVASNALLEAARGGHLTLVLELLAAGADPRVDGSRALVEAAAAGHSCVALALLMAGGQPHARNRLALRQAARGHHQVLEFLRAAVSRTGEDPGTENLLLNVGASCTPALIQEGGIRATTAPWLVG
ncbi:hypothetical protein Vretimale_8946 [Volvox reticuliferus]|uniref:Ankyrin repeat protein n=1 Tax=Volvox reticuliferus TaxID=1737510 RepID=A0A8J4CR60_9CHLO|nr:hypothetical protein Vretifemale_14403 [Volvox reticuliferus]GIM04357.1 hypothetical protein Vretimale_8946 [Volvox reticuliferus]